MNQKKAKILFKILFAPLIWLFQACSPLGEPVDEEKSNNHYYNNSKSKIQYSPNGNWFEVQNTTMKADVESFQVFNRKLSRDKNNLFFEAYKVNDHSINLSTFYVKEGDYMGNLGFDENFVYAFKKNYDQGSKSTLKIVKDVNPKTYIRTDWNWANDGKNHFYKEDKIDVDFESFKVLNEFFVKDKYHVYAKKQELFEPITAIQTSFKIIDQRVHGIDEHQVYWKPFYENKEMGLIAIPYKDNNEVTILNNYFLKIGDRIFYDGIEQSTIDNKSFEVIDHSYSKDVKNVYYRNKIVEGADPLTFNKMKKGYKYADKNGEYDRGKRLE